MKENGDYLLWKKMLLEKKIMKTLKKQVELAVDRILTKEEMDKGEDYTVMRENLEALKKTTDQPGKDIQIQNTQKTKNSPQRLRRQCCKIVHFLITLANGKSVYPYLVDGN